MQLGLARPAARSRRGSTHSLFRHVWEVAKSLGPGQVGGNDSDYLESPFNVQIIDTVSVKEVCASGTGLRYPQETELGSTGGQHAIFFPVPLGKHLKFKVNMGKKLL